MTHTDIGRTESAQRRRSKRESLPATPSELLILLHKRFPKDDREELKERFREQLRKDEALVDAVADDWFSIKANKLLGPSKKPEPRPSPAEQEAKAKARADAVKAQAAALAASILQEQKLNMQFGDKKLRDMTREECVKIGGVLTRIAAVLRPGQKVGDALSEKQLQQLFK